MCRHLSSRLFASKAEFHPIFDFLSSLHSNGKRLMLNESITTYEEMGTALTKAEKLLEDMDAEVRGLPLIWCISARTGRGDVWKRSYSLSSSKPVSAPVRNGDANDQS